MNERCKSLDFCILEFASARFITQQENGLLLAPRGSGKSHFAQAIGFAVIQQGDRVLYREVRVLL